MNTLLRATSLAFALAVPAAASAHASFADHTVTVQYGMDLGLGTGFQALQTFVVTVGDAVELPAIKLNNAGSISWSVNLYDTGLSLKYVGSGDFMNFGSPAFLGFRIADAANQLPSFSSVSVANTAYVSGQRGNLIEGFQPSDHLAYSADAIWLNLNESMYHHHAMPGMGDPLRDEIRLNVGFAGAVTPPVPEPESWALMLAGLGLAGWAARRARRI